MPRLLQRRLRCFYCNGVARNDQAGIPRTWHCPHCEAVNHLDQVSMQAPVYTVQLHS
jgi:phage FluMu protein Com